MAACSFDIVTSFTVYLIDCSELLVVDAAQSRGWSTKFSLAAVNTALVRLPVGLCS